MQGSDQKTSQVQGPSKQKPHQWIKMLPKSIASKLDTALFKEDYPRRNSNMLDYAAPIEMKPRKEDSPQNVPQRVSFSSHSEVALNEDCRTRNKSYTARRSNSDVLDYVVPFETKTSQNKKTAKASKKVSFSSQSEVALYEVCRTHKKSYTARHEQLFQAQATLEAYRIRDTILSRQTNTRNPLKHLIEQGILSPEELVGLEDKIADISGKKKAYESRIHAAFLMDQQKKLRSTSENGEVDPEKLATAATVSSSKHVRKARGRAALAA